MSISLKNFKKNIDPTILARGREYYKNRQVIDLEEVGDGAWSAQVQGSEDYSVDVRQDELGNLNWNCNCPYDLGPLCKHVAAVLYAIEENFSEYLDKKPRKSSTKRKTQAEQIEEILLSLSREDLLDVLRKQIQVDRQLAASILARYGKGDEKKAYLKLVKAALSAEKDQGFIDYQGSNRAAHKIFPLLNEAQAYLAKSELQKALPIFQAAIEGIVPAIAHADDSSGQLGDCIRVSIEALQEIVPKLQGKARDEFFHYCLTEAPKDPYLGWDWCWDLAQIAADMIAYPEERLKVFVVLDQLAAVRRSDFGDTAWYSDYRRETAENIKLSVIKRLDSPEDYEKFLKSQLNLEDFREALILLYIEKGQLAEAKTLATDFLKGSKSKQYRGLEARFEDLLLKIAQKEGNQGESLHLAEGLFLRSGDFEHYEILKQNTGSAEWATYRNRLLKELARDGYRSQLVAAIYAREGTWDELLQFIQSNDRNALVEHYREELERRFPKETSAIYEKLAHSLIEQQATRRVYQISAMYLRRMQKLGEGERVKEIVAQLRSKYANRPALLDVLKKL
jgi:uncharacterized Zn finger protein